MRGECFVGNFLKESKTASGREAASGIAPHPSKTFNAFIILYRYVCTHNIMVLSRVRRDRQPCSLYGRVFEGNFLQEVSLSLLTNILPPAISTKVFARLFQKAAWSRARSPCRPSQRVKLPLRRFLFVNFFFAPTWSKKKRGNDFVHFIDLYFLT